jgi:hypothetical protein
MHLEADINKLCSIKMKILLYLIFSVLSLNLSIEDGFKTQIDPFQRIKGTWVLIGDSIDTSIGSNTNSENYDGRNALYDTLIFKKKKYHFKNCLSKDAITYYRQHGTYKIRDDSIITMMKYFPYKYSYKIDKLTKTELVIEETMYTDSLGVFRLIGYYKRKK